MAANYKSCPLKKRPVIYEQEKQELQQQPENYEQMEALALTKPFIAAPQPDDDQPQDLSLKRKASDSFEDYVVPAKREYVLNLSSKSSAADTTLIRKQPSQIMDLTASSVMLSPPAEIKTKSSTADKTTIRMQPSQIMDLSGSSVMFLPQSEIEIKSSTADTTPLPKRPSQIRDLSASSVMLSPQDDINSSCIDYRPSDIHLRGLTDNTTGYTTNPYQSAFVTAAGCNPVPALWSTYDPNISVMYPSPASSVASAASPRPNYSYQHITPPSSPGSEADCEPEDLSVRSDIPLPALFHKFDEAPSHSSSFSSASSMCSSSSNNGSSSSQNANKNYRFKCDQCNKMYSTSMGLSKHQQFHCPAAECNQEKKQHACQDCGKLYTTMGALKMHIRTHTLPCKCPICGKAFSRPWLLQGHIRTHTGEKPFKCPDCPRSFADRSNLRAHQQTHVDVKKYVCKVCNKSFSRMSLLNKHSTSNCTITIT